MSEEIPILYEWAAGGETLGRLPRAFYDTVAVDPVVGPVFRHMSPDHPAHVAAFIAGVFGGPKTYSEKHGGYREMVMHHLGKHLTEEQRASGSIFSPTRRARSACRMNPNSAPPSWAISNGDRGWRR